MQAAVGVEQLKKFPRFIEARKRNWKQLRELLDDAQDKLILPEPALEVINFVVWIFNSVMKTQKVD
ncbi:MAG: DegT/DnrJ/EryC1/StrS family aminotransferase [Coprococcus sp.]